MSENTIGRIHKTIEPNRELFFISDLHLGDGTASDSFQGKDDVLIESLEHVRSREAHLVIVGDAIDFHQAWTFSRVLRAHGKLFGVLSSLADTHGVTYIWGNHDAEAGVRGAGGARAGVGPRARARGAARRRHIREVGPYRFRRLDHHHADGASFGAARANYRREIR